MKRRTRISHESAGQTSIRGYAVNDLVVNASFAEAIYLLLRGDRPTPAEAKVFSAVLVSAIDHGLLAPSADVARRVASTGNSLNTAVAAGISALGDFHGGAVDQAAALFQTPNATAASVVTDGLSRYKRLPGFGHRLYEVDPRVAPLFTFTRATLAATPLLDLAEAVEKELARVKGKKICLNIDGAHAAILSQLGWPPALQRGVFIIARTPGLVAHAYEQISDEPPVLRSEDDIEYLGPSERPWLTA